MRKPAKATLSSIEKNQYLALINVSLELLSKWGGSSDSQYWFALALPVARPRIRWSRYGIDMNSTTEWVHYIQKRSLHFMKATWSGSHVSRVIDLTCFKTISITNLHDLFFQHNQLKRDNLGRDLWDVDAETTMDSRALHTNEYPKVHTCPSWCSVNR